MEGEELNLRGDCIARTGYDENSTKKGLKAKDCSLWAKIVGALIIVGGHILKWVGLLPQATSQEICVCGFSVMAVFSTVDLNILVDKFTKKE